MAFLQVSLIYQWCFEYLDKGLNFTQLFHSFSTAFPQLFHSFSTAFPQLFRSFSTAFPQLFYSLTHMGE